MYCLYANYEWYHTLNRQRGEYVQPKENVHKGKNDASCIHIPLSINHKLWSVKDFSREPSLVAMKYVPPTSVQLTLLDQ